MKIQEQSKVEFEYVIEDMDGNILESSDESAPMDYIHGQDDLPPKLEAALAGCSRGDDVTVEFAAGECYGDVEPEMIFSVPRSDFPEDLDMEAGEIISIAFDAEDGDAPEDGIEEGLEARVVEINADAVVLDANHPLAGIPIRFRVKVKSVQ